MNYFFINYTYRHLGSKTESVSKATLSLEDGESPLNWFASNSPIGYKIYRATKITEEKFNELRSQRVRDLRNDFKRS